MSTSTDDKIAALSEGLTSHEKECIVYRKFTEMQLAEIKASIRVLQRLVYMGVGIVCVVSVFVPLLIEVLIQ